MSRQSLRKITVGEEVYLWKREHYHLTEYSYAQCAEKVVIYLEGYKNSPLHLLFREEDNLIFKRNHDQEKWCVGDPEVGVIWKFKPRPDHLPQTETQTINLNRPAVIAGLIKYFRENGWQPKEMRKPMVVHDALVLLELIDLPQGHG